MLDRSSILLLAALAALPMAVAGCATEEIPPYGDPAEVVGGAGASSSSGGVTCTGDSMCAVSFANDVVPILEAKGKCADAQCHGMGAGTISLTAGNAETLRTELLGLTVANGPYIACEAAENSKMLCNLRVEMGVTKPPNCGSLMPKVDPDDTVDDARLNQTEYTTIEEWIKCGAPDN
ncbi:hypothetical protein [Polyangium sp. 15x6]|uniref:hypothetical protein n=1 Tax=Polyangium sp. 15x6 TaxID=3042687 RepID=UPI00249BF8AC|nr:hypothetical protein [Polyangium sp. 15x6]MDI3288840.1 hypothetical protein [Polyangium sp. 15x6]